MILVVIQTETITRLENCSSTLEKKIGQDLDHNSDPPNSVRVASYIFMQHQSKWSIVS